MLYLIIKELEANVISTLKSLWCILKTQLYSEIRFAQMCSCGHLEDAYHLFIVCKKIL